MKNSGLLSWLKSALGGAKKMLTGKVFPMNVRDLHFALLELLRDYVRTMKSFQDLAWIYVHQKVCSQNTGLIT